MAIDEALLISVLSEIERDVRTKNTAAESTACLKSHYDRIQSVHGKSFADVVWNSYSIARHVEMTNSTPHNPGPSSITNIIQTAPQSAAQSGSGSQTVIGSTSPAPEAHGIGHLKAATPLYMVIVILTFVLSLACIGGGCYGIYRNAQSATEFSLWGAKLSTGHVGVAFVGIGLIIGFFTVRSVLKSVRDIGTAPKPRARRK